MSGGGCLLSKGEVMKKEALGEQMVGIETVDKMMDRQIALRVRQPFPKQNPGNNKMPKSPLVTL
jgi:hypothetical protein